MTNAPRSYLYCILTVICPKEDNDECALWSAGHCHRSLGFHDSCPYKCRLCGPGINSNIWEVSGKATVNIAKFYQVCYFNTFVHAAICGEN